MKTLKDLAAGYKSLVGRAIYPGVSYKSSPTGRFKSSKAFKTGTLLRSFVTDSQNQVNSIGRKTITGYELVVNIAPANAPYGQYVHNGTTKMEARPYGEIPLENPTLKPLFDSMLDEFILDRVDEQLDGVFDSISKKLTQSGFEVS